MEIKDAIWALKGYLEEANGGASPSGAALPSAGVRRAWIFKALEFLA